MNKLINLIIIFISLQYLIPYVNTLFDLENILKNPHINNIYIALIIGLIQFIYNYGMKISNRKDINIKDNLLDSSFKTLVVLSGIYLFDEIKDTNIELLYKLNASDFFKYSFVTLLITFFILINCLITS